MKKIDKMETELEMEISVERDLSLGIGPPSDAFADRENEIWRMQDELARLQHYESYKDQVITGGTGYKDYRCLPPEVETCSPDYTLYPNWEPAVGFLTRGYARHCEWCVVPQKEGPIRPAAAWTDIKRPDSRRIIFLDNNVLASDHGLEQIDRMGGEPVWADFNQGLDVRFITPDIARLLARLHWIRFIRFACDTSEMLPVIQQATAYLREAGAAPSRFWAYVLVRDMETGRQRLQNAADPNLPHTYEWYVIENIRSGTDRIDHPLPLNETIALYVGLDSVDKRLGVTKDGINDPLTETQILSGSSKFQSENVAVFQHDGLTNLYFPFEGVELKMGRLSMWRLQTHEQFGGTWLSDYVPNRLGDFLPARKERQKPDCELIGQDGNIFNLMGIASRTLRRNGMAEQAKEMQDRIMGGDCPSYDASLGIIGEYANITGPDEPEQGHLSGMTMQ